MVNNLSLILVALLILCCGCIQKIDMNHNLSSLIEAERSFAATSRAKGIRDAFLSYLTDDAIVFRPRPVKAKPFYFERQHIPGTLSWYPTHADVSLAGDLGYTTGPFEYRKSIDTRQPDGCGFFVSIWQKQADNSWRVMLDVGIECPCSDTLVPGFITKKQPYRQVSNTIFDRDVEAEKAKLLEYDYKFSKRIASEGIVNAYQDYSADDIRYYRNGMFPIIGKENVSNTIADHSDSIIWKPMASNVAKSGDIGYTYGIVELMPDCGEKKCSSYLRIWKKSKRRDWKIILDLENPIPAEIEEMQN